MIRSWGFWGGVRKESGPSIRHQMLSCLLGVSPPKHVPQGSMCTRIHSLLG